LESPLAISVNPWSVPYRLPVAVYFKTFRPLSIDNRIIKLSQSFYFFSHSIGYLPCKPLPPQLLVGSSPRVLAVALLVRASIVIENLRTALPTAKQKSTNFWVSSFIGEVQQLHTLSPLWPRANTTRLSSLWNYELASESQRYGGGTISGGHGP
jgi:hypothetical protein